MGELFPERLEFDGAKKGKGRVEKKREEKTRDLLRHGIHSERPTFVFIVSRFHFLSEATNHK